jgi:hypothetical protein
VQKGPPPIKTVPLEDKEVGKLKKFMLLAALLAMLAAAAIPAIAQVTQEGEQEGESADLNQDSSST